MTCQRCKKNPATFFYEENVNGQKKKYVLCAECAEELRRSGELSMSFPSSPLSLFGDAGEDLFSGLFGGYALPATHQPRTKRCPLCGLRFSDIVNDGKVGCPQCYSTFADELAPTLSGIHGSAAHRGRRPVRLRAAGGKEAAKGSTGAEVGEIPVKEEAVPDELTQLRAELKKAIEEEAFEKAAQLRDRIKGLEGSDK